VNLRKKCVAAGSYLLLAGIEKAASGTEAALTMVLFSLPLR
jgi:hypothetical protein